MGSTWRLIKQPTRSYADMNVALRPALARAIAEGRSPSTMLITYFEQDSLGVTYYNDPLKDVNLAAAKELGVLVKSSGISGGGSMYGQKDSALCMLFLNRDDPAVVQPDELLIMKVFTAIADELSTSYQIPVRYRPLNDGEVWDFERGLWKKLVAGSIVGLGKGVQVAAGVTVGKPPAELAQQLITPPPEKFQDKVIKSVAERMGSLEQALGKAPPLAEVGEHLLACLKKSFGVELEPGTFSLVEQEYMDEGYRLYDNDEWLFNRTEKAKFGEISANLSRGEAVTKIPGGPLLRVTLLKSSDRLANILITGSLHASPIDAFKKLEDLLVGVRLEPVEVEGRIKEFYTTGIRTPMITPEVLAAAIIKASENAA